MYFPSPMYLSGFLLVLISVQFAASLTIGRSVNVVQLQGIKTIGRSANVLQLQGIKTTPLFAANTPVSADAVGDSKLTAFLADAASLGPIRFVVVGTGAILETVGSFSNLRYADTPKGRLATISTDEPCFECHLRLAEVKEVKNVVVDKFGKILRISRFLGADGSTLLSAILHNPTDRDVSSWDQLKIKYGDSFSTQQSEQSNDDDIIHDQ